MTMNAFTFCITYNNFFNKIYQNTISPIIDIFHDNLIIQYLVSLL